MKYLLSLIILIGLVWSIVLVYNRLTTVEMKPVFSSKQELYSLESEEGEPMHSEPMPEEQPASDWKDTMDHVTSWLGNLAPFLSSLFTVYIISRKRKKKL